MKIIFIVLTATLFSVSCTANKVIEKAHETPLNTNIQNEVSFYSGKYLLKGKLLTNAPEHRKVPAIIFCVGSGESSYRTNYGRFLNQLIEMNLPLDSIAVFYFDKRGYGPSEGKWYNTNFHQRAEDVKAAAKYLKSLPMIDASKIAIIGHSQGGWITQIALAQYPEFFIGGISMAGPTFPVYKQVINDYTSQLICKEGLEKEKAFLKATNKTKNYFKMASAFPILPKWKQLKVIKDFDPADHLLQIKKPLLFLFATNDALVYPDWSLKQLNETFNGKVPDNFEILTIKDANHDFVKTNMCYSEYHYKEPYADEAKKALLKWTRQNLIK